MRVGKVHRGADAQLLVQLEVALHQGGSPAVLVVLSDDVSVLRRVAEGQVERRAFRAAGEAERVVEGVPALEHLLEVIVGLRARSESRTERGAREAATG